MKDSNKKSNSTVNSKKDIKFPIGFTGFDNRLFYIQDRLSPSAFSILVRIYRMSNGYDSKPKSLSNTYFQKVCNVSKNTVTRSVKELELLGIINVQRRARANSLYCVNMKTLETLYNNIINESQSVDRLEPLDVTDVSQNRVITKENLFKQNTNKENVIPINTKVTEDLNIPFDVFWDLYDYKKSKQDCISKWHSMTDEERSLTINHLEGYIKSTPDKTYRKYPLNYLENETWNDEVLVAPSKDNTKGIAHNYGNTSKDNTYSASHKEFSTITSAYSNEDTFTDINSVDNQELDLLAKSSQIHWSELKAKGLLKKHPNPSAIKLDDSASRKVDDFLSRYGSKSKNTDMVC